MITGYFVQTPENPEVVSQKRWAGDISEQR